MSRLFVGNLPNNFWEKEIADIFGRYGEISRLNLRRAGYAPYAFVEYLRWRDAEAAIDREHGRRYDGLKLRVEYSYDEDHRASRVREPRKGDWSVRRNRDRRDRGDRQRFPQPKRFIQRSDHRIIVSGLPVETTQLELKDFMEEIGVVCYAEVSGNGIGNVEFVQKDDMLYAVEKLDKATFRTSSGETSLIHVKKLVKGSSYFGRGSRSRSPADRAVRLRSKVIPAAPTRRIPSRSPDSPCYRSRPRSIIMHPDGRPVSRSPSTSPVKGHSRKTRNTRSPSTSSSSSSGTSHSRSSRSHSSRVESLKKTRSPSDDSMGQQARHDGSSPDAGSHSKEPSQSFKVNDPSVCSLPPSPAGADPDDLDEMSLGSTFAGELSPSTSMIAEKFDGSPLLS